MKPITIRSSVSLIVLISGGWSVRPALAEPPESRPDLPASDAGRREDPEPTISTYGLKNLRGDGSTTVKALAFSPDGATLAAFCDPGVVQFYDTATARLRDTPRDATARLRISAMTYAPDGRTLAVSEGLGVISLRDVATGGRRATMNEHGRGALALAYAPDGATLASAAFEPDGLRLWDVATGRSRAVLRGHEPRPRTGDVQIRGLAFSPDGRTLASAGDDKTVRLWDVADGRLRATLEGPGGFDDVAFSPDGRTLAASGWFYDDRRESRHAIRLWDVATLQRRGLIIEDRGRHAHAKELAFLPDGTTLVSVDPDPNRGGRMVQLWDVAEGRLLDEAAIPKSRFPLCSAISPDGKLVAVGGFWSNHRFGSIDLLAVEEGKALRLREPARED